jgi:pyruvate/2-oxoglutarate dehydrogenase complex dihydrolipoamide acyltransferase (E2) component
MTLLSKNVELGPALNISPWRKVAIGTWKTAGDPSVYGFVDMDVAPALAYVETLRKITGQKITMSHLVGKIMAETLKRHPQINCVLRYGRLYPRKNVDIFFQVATDMQGEDLSGMTIRSADKKTIAQIATEMEIRVREIKTKQDQSFTKMKNLMGLLPGCMAKFVLGFAGLFMYTLNLWSPLLGSPRDPFGSAMVTNIGSIGLDMAFAPLVPYSRVPLLIAVGAVREMPFVRNGQVVAVPAMRLCATFDHRLIDGVHGAHMYKTIQKIFANPEKELGSQG